MRWEVRVSPDFPRCGLAQHAPEGRARHKTSVGLTPVHPLYPGTNAEVTSSLWSRSVRGIVIACTLPPRP